MTNSQFRAPSPLQPTALIDSANYSVNNPASGLPSRETIHRAISTAYYAVFHSISASNAAIRHGAPTDAAAAQTWTNTYREMRHNVAATRLANHLFRLGPDGQTLANAFISLKGARETADYDPNKELTTAEANYWIRQARTAIIALQGMPDADRQILMNITLTGHP